MTKGLGFGIMVKAKMHHTHLVLDETYIPSSDEEKSVLQDCRSSCMPSWKSIWRQIRRDH
jgi:hypothetical protein